MKRLLRRWFAGWKRHWMVRLADTLTSDTSILAAAAVRAMIVATLTTLLILGLYALGAGPWAFVGFIMLLA